MTKNECSGKCTICQNYMSELGTCKFCHFEYDENYNPFSKDDWDIFSAASTINRVLSYYKIGISTDDKNKRYIIFYRNCNNFYIVREFDFEDFFGVDLNG